MSDLHAVDIQIGTSTAPGIARRRATAANPGSDTDPPAPAFFAVMGSPPPGWALLGPSAVKLWVTLFYLAAAARRPRPTWRATWAAVSGPSTLL